MINLAGCISFFKEGVDYVLNNLYDHSLTDFEGKKFFVDKFSYSKIGNNLLGIIDEVDFQESDRYFVKGYADLILPDNFEDSMTYANHLINLKGVEAVKELNGAFLLIIKDNIEQKVYFVRDRFGLRTFYYYHSTDNFVFSSNVKNIVKSGVYEKELNEEGLWHLLSFPSSIEPLTIYKNIYALEKGQIIEIDSDFNLKLTFYHKFSLNSKSNLSLHDSSEKLDFLLNNSIKNKLANKNNVGSLLSGGIDSTYYSIIANKYKKDVQYITIALEDEKFHAMNEDYLASKTASLNNMNHSVYFLNNNDFTNSIADFTKLYDQPANGLSTYFYASKVAKDLQVDYLLSGIGVDEMFGGNNNFYLLPVWQILKRLPFLNDVLPSNNKKLHNIKTFAKIKDVLGFYLNIFSIFSEDEKNKLWPDKQNLYSTKELYKTKYHDLFERENDNVDILTFLFFDNSHNDQIRKMTMFNNYYRVRAVFPFLENNLVDFIQELPSKFKVQPFKTKIVLKNAAKSYLDKEVLAGSKKGFSLPIKDLMNDHLNKFYFDLLNDLKKRAIFSNEFIDELLKKQNLNCKKISKLSFLELWLQNNYDN